VSQRYAQLLGVTRLALTLGRILNIGAAAAFAAMLIASFIFEPTFRDYFGRRAALDPDVILPTMRLWVATGAPAFAAIHIMLTRLLAMIDTVRSGDPFAPENATRLRTIAWCLLVVQLFELACGIFIGVVTRAGVEMGGWDPSLSGWVAVLLLFVLARVFEEGARIRADLEGMV
jgi:hypothetical protein